MTSPEMYQSNQARDELTVLIDDYAPLVKRIAEQIKRKCPAGIELDDLIQSGTIGLLQAKQEYSPKHGASFKTYASMKIRFSIYEGLRNISGMTRDIGQYIKKISAVMGQLEKNQDAISHKKIADNLGVSSETYQRMNHQIKAQQMLSYEEISDHKDVAGQINENPYHHTLFNELKSQLKNSLNKLPYREQLILALYYNEFLSFKEIADILQLTEARVSQIHHQLLTKLKTQLKDMEEALETID